jgi:hypothetical protein
VQGVLFTIGSTEAQRKVARQTLKDMTTLLLAHTIQNIEGRTALLAGLILELNQVIASIQVTPPLQDLAKRLTGIVTKSTKLLAEHKKGLLAPKG